LLRAGRVHVCWVKARNQYTRRGDEGQLYPKKKKKRLPAKDWTTAVRRHQKRKVAVTALGAIKSGWVGNSRRE
jgi:hypothetical protein